MKRLFDRKGFTLVEVLIAVLLLTILSTAAAVATTSVLGTSADMRLAAKAEILGDQVLDVITKEMRFCDNVQFDASGNLTSFNSVSFGEDTTFFAQNGKLMIRSTGIGSDYSPIGSTAYDGVLISELTFRKSANGIDVYVAIGRGSRTLYSNGATISILNL